MYMVLPLRLDNLQALFVPTLIPSTPPISPTWGKQMLPSQVKSRQLYLGRVALSAIGWYQKGTCVNYDYTIKIKN